MRLPKAGEKDQYMEKLIHARTQRKPGQYTTEALRADEVAGFDEARRLTGLTDHQISRRFDVLICPGGLRLRRRDIYTYCERTRR